jgi:hypothetical protein
VITQSAAENKPMNHSIIKQLYCSKSISFGIETDEAKSLLVVQTLIAKRSSFLDSMQPALKHLLFGCCIP